MCNVDDEVTCCGRLVERWLLQQENAITVCIVTDRTIILQVCVVFRIT